MKITKLNDYIITEEKN